MGEANRRGTFEERKAQAIRAGRIKRPGQSRSRRDYFPHSPNAPRTVFQLSGIAMAMAMIASKSHGFRRF